jgi:integrase
VDKASATKQAKIHRVPLSAPAIELLQTIPRRGRFLFPGRNGQPITDIKRSWATICKRAGLKDFRKHDLRHSFASLLINEGLDLPVIGQLLGHSRIETTMRYSHLRLETTRAATEKVGLLLKM